MNKLLLMISLCWSIALLGAASTSSKGGGEHNSAQHSRWSSEEDAALTLALGEVGEHKWHEVSAELEEKTGIERTGKQCRERWLNHLDPVLTKGPWTVEEFEILSQAHAILGNKWSEIKKQYLPNRSENTIKNKWNAIKLKKEKPGSRQEEGGAQAGGAQAGGAGKSKRQRVEKEAHSGGAQAGGAQAGGAQAQGTQTDTDQTRVNQHSHKSPRNGGYYGKFEDVLDERDTDGSGFRW
jgi:hypothetical protein